MGVRNLPPEIRKACLILSIRPEELDVDAVLLAWKRQLASPGVHPDLGGDKESAIYLNSAKDTLMRWLGEDPGKGPGRSSRVPRKSLPQGGSAGNVLQFPTSKDSDFAKRYFRFLDVPKLGKNFGAYERVERMINEEPECAWETILMLINTAPTDDLVGNIGAGHLEDLIKQHGLLFIDKMRSEALSNERFLRALRHTWITESYEVFAEFQSLKRELGLE